MLSLVFNFCYYATFVIVPIVVFLLINDDENFHSKGGFLYLMKLIFGKRAIKKACKKIRTPKTFEEMELYENPKCITGQKKSETLTFKAVDQQGNQISLKITIREDHISESTICLRLGGITYVSPQNGGIARRHISGNHWKCDGLTFEITEPFKRCRIIFNGFLRNVSSGNNDVVEEISMRLTWNCCSKPCFSLKDDDHSLLSKCLAKTTWRDGDWLKLLGDEKRMLQFGALKGKISGQNKIDTEVNMACVKIKQKGTVETEALDKYLTIFAATENGYLVQLGIKSLRNGCKELKHGYVLTHTGSVFPIKTCNLDLNKMEKGISDKITVHVEVPKKKLKMVLTINKNSCVETKYEHFKGFKNKNWSSECTINNFRGLGIVDYWTSFQGDGLRRPRPILRQLKVETVPDVIVTPIGSEESKILELSGGKGHSLALMKSLESEDVHVPDGFIVTTEAFKKQVEQSFNLRKAIALLEDIALDREKGDLLDACKVTTELFKDHIITPTVAQKIVDELMKFRRKHDDKVIPYLRWAVRSSGITEDSENFSSAGQNETYLGSQTDKDVLVKICKCWASLYSYQSVIYRKQHGLPIRTTMAVVVQKMIPAEVSGVLFTCHPSSASPSKIVINSNFGLGETVVSGESEPDTITLSKTFAGQVFFDSIVLGSKTHCLVMGRFGIHKQTSDDKAGLTSLSKDQASKLGQIGVVLEDAFGNPRDVEWALYKDHLYILQSRPITSLNQWTDYELTHEFDSPHLSDDTFYTRANIGEVVPFAVTALTYSTVMNSVEKGLQETILARFDPYVEIPFRYNQHTCFIELLAGLYLKPMKEVDAFNKMVDLAIFGRPVLNDEINKKAIARYGIHTKISKVQELMNLIIKNFNSVKEILKIEEKLNIKIEETDSVVQVFNKIDEGLPEMIELNYKHSVISSLSVIRQYFVTKILMGREEDIKVHHYNDIAMILSSCGDVISAEVPSKLQVMGQIIRKRKLADSFLKVPPKEGHDWLRKNCLEVYHLLGEFLKDHGHRLLGEMELSLDSWAMDPSAVIKMLQVNCQFPPNDQKEIGVPKDIIEQLQSPMTNLTKKLLRIFIKQYKKAVCYREISKSTLIRATNKFRIAYKVLGYRMAKQGLLPSEGLIYHLTRYEIWQILHKKNPGLVSKALRRQRLYPTWNTLKFPEVIYGLPVPETNIEGDSGICDSEVFCSGTPVCVGEVSGRASVITSLDDVHLLKQGDVLITKSTDIGWSPYFPMLSGVVTELGGLMSHGAVVAREYGLPCIVGAQKATKMFKTEDMVHISGKNGLIKLLSR